jgi:uncharacterized protein with HEPN domain
MQQREDINKSLLDIREAIESIDGYLSEFLGEKRDFNLYRQKKFLRRSVERELEIIGEAAGRLLLADPDIRIDNARKIVDLRNRIIHGYDKVDDVLIWGILFKHLPKLTEDIDKLLR